MSKTTIKKNCSGCTQVHKCHLVVQLSPFCPKEAFKPILSLIKRNEEEFDKIRTYYKN